ncbi:hypothetical protein CapIbe_010147 [Capra ibex]
MSGLVTLSCWARCSHASLDLLQEWESRREKGVRRECWRAPHPCSFTSTAASQGSQVTLIEAVGEPTQPSSLRQRAGVCSGTTGGGGERGERGRGGDRGGGLVGAAGAELARSLLPLTARAAAQRRRIGRKCGNIWQPASLVQVCSSRWTGMRLWENTSPSSSRSVPARSTSPVPVQDRCTVTPGHWCRVSRQRRLTSAGTG